MVGLVVFTWFDSPVLLGTQRPNPAFHHHMVIGKEENESFNHDMITGTEQSVAFYILPRTFGVVIIG